MSRSRSDVIGRSGFEGGYWWGSSKPEHRSSAPVWRAMKMMALRHPETTFAVTFRALPGVDGVHALRAMLKRALRGYGLRCIDAYEVSPACPAKAHAPSATPVQFHDDGD
jgi:hypothetical protein